MPMCLEQGGTEKDDESDNTNACVSIYVWVDGKVFSYQFRHARQQKKLSENAYDPLYYT
jgi:hypothetical protein